jgi:excisionase family DNA binding protein
MVSPAQAAKLLGVHVGSVYRMIGQGRLQKYARGVGRRPYLSKHDVLALVEPRPVEKS